MASYFRRLYAEFSPAAKTATRSAWIGVRTFAVCWCIDRYVVHLSVTEGPSMMPTMDKSGNIVVVDKFTPRWLPFQRHDIIIAKSMTTSGSYVCKRLIGLPGDTIRFRQYPAEDAQEFEIVVPAGHVWIEGDNPYNSQDSRTYGPVPISHIEGRVVGRVWPLHSIQWFERGTQRPSTNSLLYRDFLANREVFEDVRYRLAFRRRQQEQEITAGEALRGMLAGFGFPRDFPIADISSDASTAIISAIPYELDSSVGTLHEQSVGSASSTLSSEFREFVSHSYQHHQNAHHQDQHDEQHDGHSSSSHAVSTPAAAATLIESSSPTHTSVMTSISSALHSAIHSSPHLALTQRSPADMASSASVADVPSQLDASPASSGSGISSV